MHVAISIAFSKAEFHSNQPNSQIFLKTGSSVYAPTITMSGDPKECMQSIKKMLEKLFEEFESKTSPVTVQQ